MIRYNNWYTTITSRYYNNVLTKIVNLLNSNCREMIFFKIPFMKIKEPNLL